MRMKALIVGAAAMQFVLVTAFGGGPALRQSPPTSPLPVSAATGQGFMAAFACAACVAEGFVIVTTGAGVAAVAAVTAVGGGGLAAIGVVANVGFCLGACYEAFQ